MGSQAASCDIEHRIRFLRLGLCAQQLLKPFALLGHGGITSCPDGRAGRRDPSATCQEGGHTRAAHGPEIQRVCTVHNRETYLMHHLEEETDGGLNVDRTKTLAHVLGGAGEAGSLEQESFWTLPDILHRARGIELVGRLVDGKTSVGQVPHGAVDLHRTLRGGRAPPAPEQQLTRWCRRCRALADELGRLSEAAAGARGPISVLVEVVPLVNLIGSHIVGKSVNRDVIVPALFPARG
mmetsp:Transcript_103301/g.258995  ORF Transcript_103301/g.258995 Transcript_103301/m.258995 type:complete len:238 (+) Transcript_103301:441-1154(+)